MRISVKVQPHSCREEVVKSPDGSLKVYLQEAPVDGKANRSLQRILADYYRVKKSDIRILTGGASRKKIIEIACLALPTGRQATRRAWL